jgi:hypothetical protein
MPYAINKELLEMATKITVASIADNADYISNADKVAEFLEKIARKLDYLSTTRAQQ